MVRDLTKGSVWKHIIVLAVTTFLGLAIQQLYNMADTVIVGQVLGSEPLAGVGASGSLYFMVVFFCIGICFGSGIPVSREFGAGDYSRMRRFVANSVWVAIAFCIVITTLTSLLCGQFLKWMNTPEEIFDYSRNYIFVIFLGLACTFFYNLLASFIRSLGDTKTPLIALIISSCANILLDFALMVWIRMGVSGAALATVISQGLSGLYCLIVLFKKFEIMKITRDEWKPRLSYMRNLCGYGLPMGLQYSITAIGSLVLQAAFNSFGAAAVTGMTVANKVTLLLGCPLDGLGQIMSPFAGQNLGAGTYSRIKEGLFKATLLGFAWSVIVFPIILFAGRSVVGFFISEPTEEIIRFAFISMICTAAFNPLLTIVDTFRFTIQGIGFTSLAMISGALEMVGRIISALVLAPALGYTGAAIGSAVAWLFADCFLIPCFFACFKKVQRSPSRSGA